MTFEPPPLAAAFVAGAALLALLVAVDLLWARRRRLQARVDAFCLGRTGTRRGAAATVRLTQDAAGLLSPALAAVGRTVFPRERDRADMRSLLRAAGVTGEHGLALFAGVKLLCLAVCAGLAFAALGALAPDLGALFLITAVGGAGFLGAVAPEMILRARRDGRRRRMQDTLPDVIDLLVIAAYGGQSLDMAIDRVAAEMRGFNGEIAAELSATSAEMKALPDRAEALRAFGERLDTREARAFALTLIQSIRFGSPFSESLRTLGQDLRQARMVALEERGAKLPALLSLPLILFILPAVFIVVLGPAILSLSAMFGGGQ